MLIKELFYASYLTPKGIFNLLKTHKKLGANLSGVVYYHAQLHPKYIAVATPNRQVSYKELWELILKMAAVLELKYKVKAGKKVVLMCQNNLEFIQILYALIYLGAEIYLVNTELGMLNFKELISKNNKDLWIVQTNYIKHFEHENLNVLDINILVEETNSFNEKIEYSKNKSGKVIVNSGGTSGKLKTIQHKPKIKNFLNPFFELLVKLKLARYNSLLITTPLYHGFGLTSLMMGLALGVKNIVYETKVNSELISFLIKVKPEVVATVPTVIDKFLSFSSENSLPFKCIISGGAPLSERLITDCNSQFGPVLHNLYGSTEVGFSMLATNKDLLMHGSTIGTPVRGVKVKVLNEENKEAATKELGEICILSNRAALDFSAMQYIGTGDIGYQNEAGKYFVKGRKDNMLICGGVNVFPEEVAALLCQNPTIRNAEIITKTDEKFGQIMVAKIELKEGENTSVEELKAWCKLNMAAYQVPKELVLVERCK